MGKKIKKKGRIANKEKMAATISPKAAPKKSSRSVPVAVDGVSVAKERTPCAHLESANLIKLTETIGSAEPVKCQNCREDASERRTSKGKGKGKKGNGGKDLNSKVVWVCVDCGHYACGGLGLPTISQCHSVHHYKTTHHPVAMQFNNPHLCYCFPCCSLLPVKKSLENGENKDTLSEMVKLIKGRSVEGASGGDVEDVWFGGGSIKSDIISEGIISNGLDRNGGYVVRGLANLGNTCFFNSIMQNLLAMKRLRDYLVPLDFSFGPLTVSLHKLFVETSPEIGLRNVITPKSFLGCVFSKSPQFRGYQQHDSHELLRCLLDGLCMEELGHRKQNSSKENGGSHSQVVPTFVDEIFGGQISSTVCCMECGHSSTVYEAFLDLSLPVPTKKTQSKKAKPALPVKKTKVPPKRAGRLRSKAKTDENLVLGQGVSESSDASNSFQQLRSTVPDADKIVVTEESTLLDFINPTIAATVEPEKAEVMENDLDSPWLDYLGPESFTDDYEAASQYNDTSDIQESVKEDIDKELMHNNPSPNMEPNLILNDSSKNSLVGEVPLQVQGPEVMLLPYKDEISNSTEKIEEDDASSVVGHEQDSLDFNGLGDLFNEPETFIGPSANPVSCADSQEKKVVEFGSFAGNSSESTDEVDNTDSPVSIESCLAYFTKSELLSNEHAWHCENCSKQLLREKMRISKNQVKSATKSETDFNISIGSLEPKNVNDDSNQNCKETESKHEGEISFAVSQHKEAQPEMAAESQTSSNYQSCDSCSFNEPNGNIDITSEIQKFSNLEAKDGESEDSESEEVDSESIKVKRDATKRFFIDKCPPVLTIHLKRFSQDARGRLNKLNGHVCFQDTLNLIPFMDPRHKNTEKCDYRLLGVVEHLGTMRGGHYVAYVRGGAKKIANPVTADNESFVWYHASDAYVREVSLEEVLRCEAYILFYEKI